MQTKKTNNLPALSTQIRIETLKGLGKLGFGHVGGSFSVAELLAVLYGKQMRYNPEEPNWPDRDYLVCSKGHAGPAVYAALALSGFFPTDWLLTINTPGTRLPSHCDRLLTPGVDMTTGSLGQGASTAVGIALANRLQGRDSYTYLILGDGEIQEGQVWEAMSMAAQLNLDHLITFVDYNKKQLDGYLCDINNFDNIAERMAAFGLEAVTVDGHDTNAIDRAIDQAKASGRATCIVLDTVKAKDCSFAENVFNNHSVTINEAQLEEGLSFLNAKLKEQVRDDD
jgi:transketolase